MMLRGDFMEIRAKSKFNFKTIRAMSHMATYKKAKPLKRLALKMIISAMLLAFLIVELVFIGPKTIIIIALVANIILLLLEVFNHFVLPKIQYASLGEMKEAENEYIFYDNYVKEYTKAENYNAEADIQYEIFKKVYETGEYLFLYKNNNQVYIVEKSTIENGTVGELRSKLMYYVGNKYYICKY